MKVPFVDLRAQHDEVRGEIEAAIQGLIDQSRFIGGEPVESFERNFAAFCGSRYAVACASGTDALKLGLLASGVGPGDGVITVPNTFIATVEAILLVGASPILVDIDKLTYNLSPQKLQEFLEKKCTRTPHGQTVEARSGRVVKVILPVHLYGLPAEMEAIMGLAQSYGLKVIEDACQAHGATYVWGGAVKKVGTFGQTAAFSFYPGKNLGAIGEGGAVTTDAAESRQLMRLLRDHGQREKYVHESPLGWNGRLDALQGAVLDIKLQRLADWNERRRQAAAWYRTRLAGEARLELPGEVAGCRHVYHLFVVRVPNREKVRQQLEQEGIGVGLHYPIPLHLQPAFKEWGGKPGDFPEAEAAAASILSLPMFPHISEAQVDYVCRTLQRILD